MENLLRDKNKILIWITSINDQTVLANFGCAVCVCGSEQFWCVSCRGLYTATVAAVVVVAISPMLLPFATFKISGIAFTWVMLHMLESVVFSAFSLSSPAPLQSLALIVAGAWFKHNKFLIWMWPIVSGKSSFLIWNTKSHKFQWRHGLAITNHTHAHTHRRIHAHERAFSLAESTSYVCAQTLRFQIYALTQLSVDKSQ